MLIMVCQQKYIIPFREKKINGILHFDVMIKSLNFIKTLDLHILAHKRA